MFLRDALLREFFRNEALVSTCWVAMTRRVPESNASGSQLDEPVGLNYGRVELPFGTANWGLTGFNEVYNLNEVLFPAPSGYWGLMMGWAVCTLETGGETLGVGSIQNPLRVSVGSGPKVKAGGLIFGLEG